MQEKHHDRETVDEEPDDNGGKAYGDDGPAVELSSRAPDDEAFGKSKGGKCAGSVC